MHKQLRTALHEATRLTRAGRLREATALIQQTLHGTAVPVASPVESPQVIIEGTFRSDPAPPTTAPAMQGVKGVPRRRSVAYAKRGVPGGVAWPLVPPERLPEVVVPTGGQFLSASYTGQAGTRDYKLYIPSGYHGQALPLVVMLHGCTQTPDDFAVGTGMHRFAEEQCFFVAYPAQESRANQSRCWNWFQAADQERDRGEPALIAGITRQILRDYHLDARRVYVAGLSAGAAMAVILGTTYPDLYAAVGVHSGLPYGAAHDIPSALAAMHQGRTNAPSAARGVPTIVFHGDKDTTVHQRNGEAVIAQALAAYTQQIPGSTERVLHMQAELGQEAAGRAYTRTVYRDAAGQAVLEQWLIHGAGHAWSGGSSAGSYTDASGPNATKEMMRFFAAHAQPVLPQRQ